MSHICYCFSASSPSHPSEYYCLGPPCFNTLAVPSRIVTAHLSQASWADGAIHAASDLQHTYHRPGDTPISLNVCGILPTYSTFSRYYDKARNLIYLNLIIDLKMTTQDNRWNRHSSCWCSGLPNASKSVGNSISPECCLFYIVYILHIQAPHEIGCGTYYYKPMKSST